LLTFWGVLQYNSLQAGEVICCSGCYLDWLKLYTIIIFLIENGKSRQCSVLGEIVFLSRQFYARILKGSK